MTSILLGIKSIAADAADIADAVDVNAVGSVRPAHVNRVAGRRVAVFAGKESADAGNVFQRVGEVSDALVLHHLLRDHANRPRRVGDRA